MAEYVRRSDVYKIVKSLLVRETGALSKGYNKALRDIMIATRSEAIPSADVVEVKTADWIPYGKEIEIYCWYGKCSNCGEDIFPDDYCPCCGSKLNIPEDIARAPTSTEEEGT